MSFLCRAIIFLGVIVAAQCLTCNLCVFGSSGTCSNKGNITCDNRTSSCFNAQANITTANATASLTLVTRGCVQSFICGSSSGSILGFDFNVSVNCCNTDLCNGASSLQLPLIVTLCFGTLTSLWVMT
ncbi:hypothetical protein D4764_21G0004780 [Takifugu flavidus]|uniref:UPAR/Ly6 domain-containing protein n=1 Tax=Takifugu flavidus TaxID=433684 RepID=A0A5C6NFC2_9TELE|nr:hypothetical protein D4764_21G0004780 [Takifugu flavidus]